MPVELTISTRTFRILLAVCAVSIVANAYLLQRLTAADAGEAAGSEDYVEYRPVFYAQGSGSVETAHHVDRSALSPAHLEKVRVVMDRKGLAYRFEAGTLWIPREIWDDKTQVQNITSAAMNWYWLVGYAGYEGDRRGTWEDSYAAFVKSGLERRDR